AESPSSVAGNLDEDSIAAWLLEPLEEKIDPATQKTTEAGAGMERQPHPVKTGPQGRAEVRPNEAGASQREAPDTSAAARAILNRCKHKPRIMKPRPS